MGASSSRNSGEGRTCGLQFLIKGSTRRQLPRQRQNQRHPTTSDTQQPPPQQQQLDPAAVDQNASSASEDGRVAQEQSSKVAEPTLPLEEEDECAICLEGYSEESPKLLIACQHDYHLHCILEWLDRNYLCPICGRIAVFNEHPHQR